MATIHNTELFKELKEGAKLQQLNDVVPSELAKSIVPVMEVNPKLLRRVNVVRRATASNATSAAIFTIPTDKDFYLTGCSISTIKDATSTSIRSDINAFVDGDNTARELLAIASITLTAQSATNSIDFSIPVKLTRGTQIVLANSTNVANIVSIGCIYGYTVDNPLA